MFGQKQFIRPEESRSEVDRIIAFAQHNYWAPLDSGQDIAGLAPSENITKTGLVRYHADARHRHQYIVVSHILVSLEWKRSHTGNGKVNSVP